MYTCFVHQTTRCESRTLRKKNMLTGKLTLVTGAASGIGKAICSVLLREGSKVAAVDVQKFDSQTLDPYEEFHADVSSQAAILNLFRNVKSRFGDGPDCLVNCAGIVRDAVFLNMSEEEFDKVIAVNLKGTFLVSQTMAKTLVNKFKSNSNDCRGSIVNVSSIVGRVGNVGQANYSASKAGVIGMTKTIAKELARFNIRCNVVLPGLIDTPLIDYVPIELLDKAAEQIPLKRRGTPEEIAEVCAFLLSDKSSYVTGASVEVTGGLLM